MRQGECFRAVTLPIYHLSDEMLVGYEMLSRGPEGPYQQPDEFLQVSMENGILTQVDLSCLKTCLAATNTLDQGLKFHVNLFPSTILETAVGDLIKLFPTERKNKTYCIEIIEQQRVADYLCLRDQVRALREAGIVLGVDDVGFGASFLETLILLEPEIIKIDRGFVTGAALDTERQRQLRRLVKVAQALEAEVVAEGVESTADLELLKDMGVQYGQGSLWGKLM
ncbi:MAG: EAL domain-containing protein [Candidatus Melainabacteria bacterium]|nr:EAL domain-containing protein [Candidatus Melainabacteria bacterium]